MEVNQKDLVKSWIHPRGEAMREAAGVEDKQVAHSRVQTDWNLGSQVMMMRWIIWGKIATIT